MIQLNNIPFNVNQIEDLKLVVSHNCTQILCEEITSLLPCEYKLVFPTTDTSLQISSVDYGNINGFTNTFNVFNSDLTLNTDMGVMESVIQAHLDSLGFQVNFTVEYVDGELILTYYGYMGLLVPSFNINGQVYVCECCNEEIDTPVEIIDNSTLQVNDIGEQSGIYNISIQGQLFNNQAFNYSQCQFIDNGNIACCIAKAICDNNDYDSWLIYEQIKALTECQDANCHCDKLCELFNKLPKCTLTSSPQTPCNPCNKNIKEDDCNCKSNTRK